MHIRPVIWCALALAILFGSATGARAQDPPPVPPGCAVTSAGLQCPQLPPGCVVTSAGVQCVAGQPPPTPTVVVERERAESTPTPTPTPTTVPRPEPRPPVTQPTPRNAFQSPSIQRLPFTGYEGVPVVLIGMLLLGAGMLLRRPRRRASAAPVSIPLQAPAAPPSSAPAPAAPRRGARALATVLLGASVLGALRRRGRP